MSARGRAARERHVEGARRQGDVLLRARARVPRLAEHASSTSSSTASRALGAHARRHRRERPVPRRRDVARAGREPGRRALRRAHDRRRHEARLRHDGAEALPRDAPRRTRRSTSSVRASSRSTRAETLPIELDGEQVGTTPVRFEVVPGALRVRVPALERRGRRRPSPRSRRSRSSSQQASSPRSTSGRSTTRCPAPRFTGKPSLADAIVPLLARAVARRGPRRGGHRDAARVLHAGDAHRRAACLVRGRARSRSRRLRGGQRSRGDREDGRLRGRRCTARPAPDGIRHVLPERAHDPQRARRRRGRVGVAAVHGARGRVGASLRSCSSSSAGSTSRPTSPAGCSSPARSLASLLDLVFASFASLSTFRLQRG